MKKIFLLLMLAIPLSIGAQTVYMPVVDVNGRQTGWTTMGATSVILANQIFTTNTFVNSTNGIFAIPSAGTWSLRYDVTTDGTGANTNSQLCIADNLGAVVKGTERTRGGGVLTSQVLTAEVTIITTGPVTYRLRGRNGGSGNVTLLNTANSTSTISWKRM